MEIVSSRDAATLLPIIQAHVCPGTVIWSDKWAAYRRVSTLPGIAGHQTVNHTYHFKDPVTGVHINTIESYWNRYDVIIYIYIYIYIYMLQFMHTGTLLCFVLCLYKQIQVQYIKDNRILPLHTYDSHSLLYYLGSGFQDINSIRVA